MDVRELARLGAAKRVAEIQAELASIKRAFPGSASRRVQTGGGGVTPVPAGDEVRRQRTPMSTAQRKAVGIRMKKYWAARRKANG